jgi:hypothetical protein
MISKILRVTYSKGSTKELEWHRKTNTCAAIGSQMVANSSPYPISDCPRPLSQPVEQFPTRTQILQVLNYHVVKDMVVSVNVQTSTLQIKCNQ